MMTLKVKSIYFVLFLVIVITGCDNKGGLLKESVGDYYEGYIKMHNIGWEIIKDNELISDEAKQYYYMDLTKGWYELKAMYDAAPYGYIFGSKVIYSSLPYIKKSTEIITKTYSMINVPGVKVDTVKYEAFTTEYIILMQQAKLITDLIHDVKNRSFEDMLDIIIESYNLTKNYILALNSGNKTVEEVLGIVDSNLEYINSKLEK